MDGTLISHDRRAGTKTSKKGKEIDMWYLGKAHAPGGNVQALAAPAGVPLWVSDVLPRSTHDLAPARELVLPGARLYLTKVSTLADSGYEGVGAGVHVPWSVERPRIVLACAKPGSGVSRVAGAGVDVDDGRGAAEGRHAN